MNKPMTTEQADEKYLCDMCKKYGHGACEFDCVLSSTCSMFCRSCDKRVFFSGDLKNTPKTYICPYCKTEQTNPWSKKLK